MDKVIELFKQCDAWEEWMINWLVIEGEELQFYAPDNELLVHSPVPTTLTDTVQFLKNLSETSYRWAKQQDESQS